MKPDIYTVAETACEVYKDRGCIKIPAGYKMVGFLDSEASTQCAIFKKGDTLLVAFRGTKEPRDFVTDIKFGKSRFNIQNPKGKIHDGFSEAYRDVRIRLHKLYFTHRKQVTEVIFTGHSLGGALSTIAAYDFKLAYKRDLRVCCLTLGSPRVGNHSFARHFNEIVDESTRIINGGDPVTQLPTRWTCQYCHVKGKYRVGKLTITALLKALVSPKINLLTYHSCTNYLKNIRSKFNG
jgi:predicted lipase